MPSLFLLHGSHPPLQCCHYTQTTTLTYNASSSSPGLKNETAELNTIGWYCSMNNHYHLKLIQPFVNNEIINISLFWAWRRHSMLEKSFQSSIRRADIENFILDGVKLPRFSVFVLFNNLVRLFDYFTLFLPISSRNKSSSFIFT
ncbi:hypothetical protein KSP39_PZI012727 [Platanthera zijinensis]|uniref:Uncharacterized protein n=1 Tax=Platanthera zijinensis TaxID=2320716 RepID=A0AAP0BGH6_9ASPA